MSHLHKAGLVTKNEGKPPETKENIKEEKPLETKKKY
jgi:hypothetical protein